MTYVADVHPLKLLDSHYITLYVHLNWIPIDQWDENTVSSLRWFKNPVSCQAEKLMAGTKFSDYLGLKHYKKAKKIKTFQPFRVG